MRMAAGYEPDMRQSLLEKRGITPAMFAAFCKAEGISPEGAVEDSFEEMPLEKRLQLDIGTFRGRVGERLQKGVDDLSEYVNTVGEAARMRDEDILALERVGPVAVQALNAVCALLPL